LKHLSALNKYFWKYRYRFVIGIFFVSASNYLAVLAPEITGYIIGKLQEHLPGAKTSSVSHVHDWLVLRFVAWINDFSFTKLVAISSMTILLLAILRGVFMFFMRQTIIVMSRYVEYDQKMKCISIIKNSILLFIRHIAQAI